MDIQTLVKMNDSKLKKRQDQLMQEVNRAYDEAVAKATKELIGLDKENINRQELRNILTKSAEAFKERYNELVEIFKKEILESYEEGLKETGQILELAKK